LPTDTLTHARTKLTRFPLNGAWPRWFCGWVGLRWHAMIPNADGVIEVGMFRDSLYAGLELRGPQGAMIGSRTMNADEIRALMCALNEAHIMLTRRPADVLFNRVRHGSLEEIVNA
jgi:hypothetical protein